MKIIFWGSSQFALPSLKALLNGGYDIPCVITQPDRKKGRGLSLSSTAVKKLSQECGLKIYQPTQVNVPEVIEFLKGLQADLFVVISYGQILSSDVLAIPRIFAVNAHASLLPKYRGAAPINWAIIKGETTTGVTIIKMTEKMDAGPIILQKESKILDDDNSINLEDRLGHLAAELLLGSLTSLKNNNYNLKPQDETQVSMAPKLKKEDGIINWGESANQIYNLIRGCRDWPSAFTYYKGKLLKIYKANISSLSDIRSQQSGRILEVSPEGITVATGNGNLVIEELQIEGKRIMAAKEFILGHRISVGETLENKK
jgi:methionyl-tRNA formyltransferase